MRDPNRIYKYCFKLADIWNKVPDWRLGQFMINMVTIAEYDGNDVFYMEDDEFMKMIEDYFTNKD